MKLYKAYSIIKSLIKDQEFNDSKINTPYLKFQDNNSYFNFGSYDVNFLGVKFYLPEQKMDNSIIQLFNGIKFKDTSNGYQPILTYSSNTPINYYVQYGWHEVTIDNSFTTNYTKYTIDGVILKFVSGYNINITQFKMAKNTHLNMVTFGKFIIHSDSNTCYYFYASTSENQPCMYSNSGSLIKKNKGTGIIKFIN